MTVPAKVLVPLTERLELPVLFVMLAVVPLIDSEPTVKLFCRSSVALLITNAPLVLPSVPEPLNTNVPALIVVPPV